MRPHRGAVARRRDAAARPSSRRRATVIGRCHVGAEAGDGALEPNRATARQHGGGAVGGRAHGRAPLRTSRAFFAVTHARWPADR
ncbi:MAG: hypothetical protein AVDCRST_MAG49-2672 [uncultured Thermomicrobiales bacterium]|uniref:Uncharacterized protein n=1 Tax=uncultured Thermomicrobiales bacterium TaxID=1645740 RepID=A0A6J4V1Y0_9BACT|nr:MAG: hypothetical protein AVDCRST_MAG49-2672 [uncultured Thermomicrobiales bacterium]